MYWIEGNIFLWPPVDMSKLYQYQNSIGHTKNIRSEKDTFWIRFETIPSYSNYFKKFSRYLKRSILMAFSITF